MRRTADLLAWAALVAVALHCEAHAQGPYALVAGRWEPVVVVVDIAAALEPENDLTANAVVGRVRVTLAIVLMSVAALASGQERKLVYDLKLGDADDVVFGLFDDSSVRDRAFERFKCSPEWKVFSTESVNSICEL